MYRNGKQFIILCAHSGISGMGITPPIKNSDPTPITSREPDDDNVTNVRI
jgi:hypothetical protein